MSLFDFGITSSKKRKSDANIHGDEAKKKKKINKHMKKNVNLDISVIFSEKKNMYFLKHLTGNQMANRIPKHGYDMMKSHKKCTAYCVRSFQR